MSQEKINILSNILLSKIKLVYYYLEFFKGIESYGFDCCEIWRRDTNNLSCRKIYFYFLHHFSSQFYENIEDNSVPIRKKKKPLKPVLLN